MGERPNNRMGGFIARLMVYVLPFGLGFGALTGGLIVTGEAMPLDMVITLQHNSDETLIYRPRYGHRDLAYKRLSLERVQPEIAITGSSRVLQVREQMFQRQPGTFYNAAGPAWTLDELLWLLRHVDANALPEVLIVAFDMPWFAADFDEDEIPRPVGDFAHVFEVNRAFLQDVMTGGDFSLTNETVPLRAYLARETVREPRVGALGLRAIRDGQGFRQDGSELFGDFLIGGWLWQPQQRERHLNLMRHGEYVYPYGETVSEAAMGRAEALVRFAAERDIFLIGLLPPYMPTLWQEMLATGRHDYVPQVTERLRGLLGDYGYPLLDFSDGATFGTRDADYYDGWHPSELASALMMLNAVGQVQELQAYIDPDALLRSIQTATDGWWLYGS